ncbi:hypothetical protein BDZ45DRAFT_667537 [Acephala macrosclerotiorum]|nr:hypothetical protein BDZ45DRAFT_667537 [Acephala macrosclerotiorum]
MPPSLVFFTGAPQADTLKWDGDHLLKTFIGPIARFAGLDIATTPESSTIPQTLEAHPAWRSLPLVRQQLSTGLTQDFDRHQVFEGRWESQGHGTSFFTSSQIDTLLSELSQEAESQGYTSSLQSQEVLSQFYGESYERYEDVQSSQIAPASDAGSSFTSDEFSYESTSFDSFGPRDEVPIAGRLSNLKDMPNAKYLDSIQPQTMTVNLIVGIISMPQPRSIRTRRGAAVELIEVLVGDETKSGFGVNFWLSSSQPAAGDMRSVLDGLRPQDVVLMRNVALSSFKGRVYGQSLRKEMTKVHLLYRNRVDRDDVGGCYKTSDLVSGEHVHPQVEKTRKVREWVMRFVGAGPVEARPSKKKGRATEIAKEVLPPDTQ